LFKQFRDNSVYKRKFQQTVDQKTKKSKSTSKNRCKTNSNLVCVHDHHRNKENDVFIGDKVQKSVFGLDILNRSFFNALIFTFKLEVTEIANRKCWTQKVGSKRGDFCKWLIIVWWFLALFNEQTKCVFSTRKRPQMHQF
jgi:hypothetical protein